MQKQSRNPNQGKSNPSGSQQQNPQQGDTRRRQDKGQGSNRQAENDERDLVSNQEEQGETTNVSAPGSSERSGRGKEKSFYKNDLPESEEGTDVDEQSRNLRP